MRFLPPQPAPAWGGVREAEDFGLAAPQPTSPWQSLVGGQSGGWSEDCLFVNVFAPERPAGDLLPVMVWIHGGAFIGGSGSARWYDGGRFAAGPDGGAVVVTLNYRLGALGFLDLSSTGVESSGNLGLLDQLAALRWVRDNIAAFGGDPTRVTVFGESAGAMSIGTLLAMPAAAGLFHQAILQSGAAAAYQDREQAAAVTARMLTVFGGSVDRLLAAPAEEILAAQAAVAGSSDAPSYLVFRPVVDGVHLPEAPDAAIRGGRSWAPREGVAVIVGTNRDEMTLFVQFDPGATDMSEAQLERRAVALFGADRWRHLAGGYRRFRPDIAARWVAVTTDLMFRMPAVHLAEALATQGRAPVFMYRLDWPSPVRGGHLGATHGLDIPFMWDLLDYPGVELFTGTAPGGRQLAKAMHGAWLSFAQRGRPAAPHLPAWPPYQPPARATMIFDAPCRVEEDPNGEERRLWDAVA